MIMGPVPIMPALILAESPPVASSKALGRISFDAKAAFAGKAGSGLHRSKTTVFASLAVMVLNSPPYVQLGAASVSGYATEGAAVGCGGVVGATAVAAAWQALRTMLTINRAANIV